MKYDEVYKKNFFVHYQNLLWSGTYIGLQDPLSEKNHQRKEKIYFCLGLIFDVILKNIDCLKNFLFDFKLLTSSNKK